MKLTFLGAAGTVTGSRTLVSFKNKKFLIDCGLFQGPKSLRQRNWNPFPVSKNLDGIILTHAHLDHSGFLPRLVKEGYAGPVYCTPGTADLVRIMLIDSAFLQEEDAQYANRTGYSHHKPAEPLYTIKDAERANQLLVPVQRKEWTTLTEGLDFEFIRSGHILGSSYVHMSYETSNGTRLVTFTGDLGNGRSTILKPPEQLIHTDYLVLESTYGDRLQERVNPSFRLAPIINKVIARQGVLLIPAFSVGRTQEILHLMQTMEAENLIPKTPVYLDSPMAREATRIFMKHPEDHALGVNGDLLESPISTKDYHTVTSQDESIALCQKPGPMVIISASGMLTGGRVMHHLKARIENPENGKLMVGYQAEETKGRLLQGGINSLRIHHKEYAVRAEVLHLDNLSAHADQRDILEWINGFEKRPEKIFLNHGEPKSQLALRQKIETAYQIPVTIPQMGESIELRA